MVTLYNIIKSLSLVTMVSTSVAYFAYTIQINPWSVFVLTVILQLLGYNLIKYYRDTRLVKHILEMETREIESFEKQGMELECAHCRTLTYVPIRFNEQNTFTCPACDKSNSLYLNVTVARETTPLNIEAVTTRLLIDEEERVKDSIRSNDDE